MAEELSEKRREELEEELRRLKSTKLDPDKDMAHVIMRSAEIMRILNGEDFE